MSRVIRWGVAGCGQIAVDKTIPGLLAARGARLVAIADPLPARRELALGLARGAGLNEVRAVDYDTELLLQPDIDAVYIAMPTGLHAGAVTAAARAGKAILCEKPLGNHAHEVREMVRAAEQHGVPLMTGYMSRFSDVYQKAAELIQAGAIGTVSFVSAHFAYRCFEVYPPHAAGGWRYTDAAGGGPLLDIGVYLAFGVRELLADRIARVSPLNLNTFAPAGSAIADTSAAWFVTDRGTPGTLATSFSHAGLSLNVFGTRGSVAVSDLFHQRPGALLVARGDGLDLVLDTRHRTDLPHFDNYRREFEHFSQALLQGTPHRPSAHEVLSDALVLDALKNDGGVCEVPTPAQFLQQRS